MNCSNCKNIHKVTNLTYTANTSLVLTVSNSTNINSLDDFCFYLTQNVSNTVTDSPVQVYININGVNYQLFNKYHLPVFSNNLYCRKLYKAWYVNDGTNGWIELKDLPKCKANA